MAVLLLNGCDDIVLSHALDKFRTDLLIAPTRLMTLIADNSDDMPSNPESHSILLGFLFNSYVAVWVL